MTGLKCFYCGEAGHKAMHCPKNPQWCGEASGLCVVHNRLRSVSNLALNPEGSYQCTEDAPCTRIAPDQKPQSTQQPQPSSPNPSPASPVGLPKLFPAYIQPTAAQLGSGALASSDGPLVSFVGSGNSLTSVTSMTPLMGIGTDSAFSMWESRLGGGGIASPLQGGQPQSSTALAQSVPQQAPSSQSQSLSHPPPPPAAAAAAAAAPPFPDSDAFEDEGIDVDNNDNINISSNNNNNNSTCEQQQQPGPNADPSSPAPQLSGAGSFLGSSASVLSQPPSALLPE
eukprot:PhM_4_TR18724/c4_g1_i2/m.73262